MPGLKASWCSKALLRRCTDLPLLLPSGPLRAGDPRCRGGWQTSGLAQFLSPCGPRVPSLSVVSPCCKVEMFEVLAVLAIDEMSPQGLTSVQFPMAPSASCRCAEPPVRETLNDEPRGGGD